MKTDRQLAQDYRSRMLAWRERALADKTRKALQSINNDLFAEAGLARGRSSERLRVLANAMEAVLKMHDEEEGRK